MPIVETIIYQHLRAVFIFSDFPPLLFALIFNMALQPPAPNFPTKIISITILVQDFYKITSQQKNFSMLDKNYFDELVL